MPRRGLKDVLSQRWFKWACEAIYIKGVVLILNEPLPHCSIATGRSFKPTSSRPDLKPIQAYSLRELQPRQGPEGFEWCLKPEVVQVGIYGDIH